MLEDLVWQHASGRCEYCRISRDNLDLPFEVNHIIAEHHPGRTQASNLCLGGRPRLLDFELSKSFAWSQRKK
jgi:hypothetical protein